MSKSNQSAGVAQQLELGLVRILAPNPSPMTAEGTNTYLLGKTDIAVIDPGPASPRHLAAILAAVPPGARISHILITHSHVDHSQLAGPLSDATGAPVFAFGPSGAGRSAIMSALATDGATLGGEGVDLDFRPDVDLPDGAMLQSTDWQLVAHWTPGHFGNHLCFAWNDRMFTGDHVMGWASSLISPPDGDMTQYMASLARLAATNSRIYYPGHGAEVRDPASRTAFLTTHRKAREATIVASLGSQALTIEELLPLAYRDVAPALWPAAARNLFAHLVDLEQRNEITAEGGLHIAARFRRI